MSEPQEYKKLDKTATVDNEAVSELAAALNELKIIEDRATFLRELVEDNDELHGFVWTTLDGRVMALHEIEDSHLANIMRNLNRRGVKINKQIIAEARKRKILVPEAARCWQLEAGDDEETINLDEIDF